LFFYNMNRFIYLILTGFISVAFLLSCNHDDDLQKDTSGKKPENTVKPIEKPTDFKAIELDSRQQNANIGSYLFAYEFLKECLVEANKYDEQNFMVSPLGFSNLLTMLANGANKETLAQISEALGSDPEDLNSFYSLIAIALPAADNQVVFKTANSIWIQNGVEVKAAYSDLLKSRFNADIFTKDLPTIETMDSINQWCSDHTGGMIDNFLKRPLNPLTLAFIANALYFNGKWTVPFQKELTEKEEFRSVSGKVSEVEMMNGNEEIGYMELPGGGELISIPYGNKSFSFNIYLPKEGETIENAVNGNNKFLTNTIDNSRNCFLTLPKFRVSFELNTLNVVAEKLGLTELFKENALSGIAEDMTGGYMKQVTEFVIDESGAEAAAVTGMEFVSFPGDVTPSTPVIVKVNRPFIFSITETTNNIVLFAGVIREL
ncbi:MAG: hypothetical protein K2J70_06495, partial [Muribaculaceae bacterium]|nr:hypothetical protein [Muribaculaceae bacterium]